MHLRAFSSVRAIQKAENKHCSDNSKNLVTTKLRTDHSVTGLQCQKRLQLRIPKHLRKLKEPQSHLCLFATVKRCDPEPPRPNCSGMILSDKKVSQQTKRHRQIWYERLIKSGSSSPTERPPGFVTRSTATKFGERFGTYRLSNNKLCYLYNSDLQVSLLRM